MPIAAADIVGKREANHLKLLLDFGQAKWPALWWSAAEKLERDFSVKDRIDLVFKVTVNRYAGQEQPQLEIIDARRSEPEAVGAAGAGASVADAGAADMAGGSSRG